MVADGPPRGATDLDHVGIERALGEEVGPAELRRLLLEHLDEQPADRLALGLRVGHAVEPGQEQVRRVAVHQADVEAVAEGLHHLLRLARAQQAVVDEDAGQLVADRLMDQHRGDRAVDPAGQAADHPSAAHLGADAADLGGAEIRPSSRCRAGRRRGGRSCAAAPRRAGCARPRGGTARRRSGWCRRRWRRTGRLRSRRPDGSRGAGG